MRCTTTGARPRESSSSISTRGLATSARPMATACCSPPDSCAVRWVRRSLIQPNSSYTCSIVHGPFRAYVAPTCRFSSTVSDPNSRRPSGTMTIPLVARRSGRTLVMSLPSYTIEPSVGLVQAGDRAQQRGLARAVRADDRVHLAGEHPQRDVVQRPQLAVVHGEVADLEQGASRWPPGPFLGGRLPPRRPSLAVQASRGLSCLVVLGSLPHAPPRSPPAVCHWRSRPGLGFLAQGSRGSGRR